jgi:DNA repair protein RadA/Sms
VGDRIYTDIKSGINAGTVTVLVLSGESTLQTLNESPEKPDFVMIDSIQTMQISELSSSPGSIVQVRESTNMFLRVGKNNNIPIFIVGHVNKGGDIAGPKILEHIVDTVLYFEGERNQSYRILRAIKNRFGSTNEIGVFEMRQNGLVEVENPSEFMLNGKPAHASGSVVACSMEGTRPILIEIQALVCNSNFGMPRRTAAGTDYNRVNLLMAVLEKRLGLHLSNCDAYVNIAGGVKMNEPAIDLGIIMAVVSSYKNKAVDEKTIVFGEVGLSGEVRAVSMPEQRVAEAKKLGFKTCIIPEVSKEMVKGIQGIRIIGVKNIGDAVGLIG